MNVVSPGAEGSKGALGITGKVVVGKGPMRGPASCSRPDTRSSRPPNLSAKKELSFWAKGDGRTYVVLMFAESRGYTPAALTFAADKAWKRYTFALSQFDGLDGHDLMGIFFGAAPPAGKFSLQIDRVELH